MYRIKVNDEEALEVKGEGAVFSLNDEAFPLDIVKLSDVHYHLIHRNKNYNLLIESFDAKAKAIRLNINGRIYETEASDKYDLLLDKLGIDLPGAGAVEDLKAPMPGLVIDIPVENGQEVKKGDPLLVLEAMKMENVMKAEADAVVKVVNVEKGQAVEKNQLLVSFEE